MKRLLAAAALVAIAACSGESSTTAQSGLTADAAGEEPGAAILSGARASAALRFEPAVIVDASGFERPLAAATLFVPFGWQAAGGVLWGQDYMCTNGYNFSWQATSPDGSSSVSILPQARWEWNNYGAPPSTPGCGTAPYTNIRQYLEAFAMSLRPGVRITDYRRRADLEGDYAQFNQTTPMPMGEARSWVESGEVLYSYTDGGRAMRGSLAAVGVFSLMRTSASGMGVMDAATAFVFPGFGANAPEAVFNPALNEAIRRSIKTNPDWDRRISGHNTAIGRVALEESRKRAEMIMRSNEEISRIRQEAWSAYQESADRRAREFGELMRGVETYNDANAPGGTAELSANYNHAWRLNDGTYVLTNEEGFDPWRDLKIEGKRLEAVR